MVPVHCTERIFMNELSRIGDYLGDREGYLTAFRPRVAASTIA